MKSNLLNKLTKKFPVISKLRPTGDGGIAENMFFRKDRMWDSDLEPVNVMSLILPKTHYHELDVPESEYADVFRRFTDCPVKLSHGDEVYGTVKDTFMDEEGCFAHLVLYPIQSLPERVKELGKKIRNLLMQGKLAEVSIGFKTWKEAGTGRKLCAPLEISICNKGKMPVGKHRVIFFSADSQAVPPVVEEDPFLVTPPASVKYGKEGLELEQKFSLTEPAQTIVDFFEFTTEQYRNIKEDSQAKLIQKVPVILRIAEKLHHYSKDLETEEILKRFSQERLEPALAKREITLSSDLSVTEKILQGTTELVKRLNSNERTIEKLTEQISKSEAKREVFSNFKTPAAASGMKRGVEQSETEHRGQMAVKQFSSDDPKHQEVHKFDKDVELLKCFSDDRKVKTLLADLSQEDLAFLPHMIKGLQEKIAGQKPSVNPADLSMKMNRGEPF